VKPWRFAATGIIATGIAAKAEPDRIMPLAVWSAAQLEAALASSGDLRA